MRNSLFRKGLVLAIACCFVGAGVVPSAGIILKKNVLEKNEDNNFKIISLKADSITGLGYSDFGHIGPIWLPISPLQFSILTGDAELVIDGEEQDVEIPTWVMLRGFFGIGPSLWKREHFDFSLNLYGICKEIIVVPYSTLNDYIYEQPLFDVFDIGDFGQSARGLSSADFNGDNYMDFVVSSATVPWTRSTISIFYNNGNLDFTQDDVYIIRDHLRYIEDLDAGDYDNDGDIDLLYTYSEHVRYGDFFVNVNGTGKILLNDGNNNFVDETMFFWHGPGIPYNYENRINPQVTSADYDLDGDRDFLVGDNSGKVELYLNDGTGNFTSNGVIHDFGYVSWGLTSGDFDNDGDIDFLVSAETAPGTSQGYVYFKRNLLMESEFSTCFEPGSGEIWLSIHGVPGTCSLQAIDYNMDGNLDFIVGNGRFVHLCFIKEDDFDIFYLGELPPNEEGYNDDLGRGALTSADYNSDGRKDLVLGGVQGIIRLCVSNFGQLPPLRPTIQGPEDFLADKELELGFVTKDVNDDDIYYYVDWGDGTNTGWVGPYSSGEKIRLTHVWDEARAYWIKAKAKDEHGAESDWKEYVLILGKGKIFIQDMFESCLQSFPCLHSDLDAFSGDVYDFVIDTLEKGISLNYEDDCYQIFNTRTT
jgi:hypothetical protein